VEFALTEQEYQAVQEAAARAGLSRGAYAAEMTVGAACGTGSGDDAEGRQYLAALIGATEQLRRAGVNLNQAVARLNATGRYSAELTACAAQCTRRAGRVGDAADAASRYLARRAGRMT
jgi:hypothetical protein